MSHAVHNYVALLTRLHILAGVLLLKPYHRTRGQLTRDAQDDGDWLYICPHYESGCAGPGGYKIYVTKRKAVPKCRKGHRMELVTRGR